MNLDTGDKGIVYILSNEAMPGLVKIGVTEQDNLRDRLKQLYNTSVPVPFVCECAVEVDDCRSVEKDFHLAFDDLRVNPNREFFKLSPEKPAALLKRMGTDVTERFSQAIDQDATAADMASIRRIRRPNIDFEEMGIPVGSTLLYTQDPSIAVKVIGNKKVEYDGKECSLSGVTKQLLNVDNVRPTIYWTFNGRNLGEIYEETYSESADAAC